MDNKIIIRAIKSYSAPDTEVINENCMYCPDDKVYYTTDNNKGFIWFETEVNQYKREIEEYKTRYENIFQGLCYWKQRALENKE